MNKLRLGLEWFLNPDHLPFLVALDRGWFAEKNLDLELVAPDAHLDAFEAIEKGELDVAITEPIHLVEDCAKGRSARGFARFLHTNGGVMYLESSGITRPKDMAGKRVQYPGAPGPGGLAMVRTMIEADGGRGDGLTPVNRGFQHTQALLDGDADVAVLAFYNFEVVEARHLGHPAQFFALKDWGVPDFCQLVLMTDPEKLEREPETFRTLLELLGRGLDFMHQRPEEAREIYFRRTETDPADPLMSAIYAATVPCFTFDLSMSSDYYAHLGGWMRDCGLVDRDVAPREAWTNALVV
ncbi:MAG: ABC transporter substrate-binding protein [Myxococcota bacterium]